MDRLAKKEITENKDENGNVVSVSTVEYYERTMLVNPFKKKEKENSEEESAPKKKMTTRGKVAIGIGAGAAAVAATFFGLSEVRKGKNQKGGSDSGTDQQLLTDSQYDPDTEVLAASESPVDG